MFLWNSQAILKIVYLCWTIFPGLCILKFARFSFYPTAGHSLKKINAGSQNCSLNAHRKSSRNVLGVFDVKNAKQLFKLFWIFSRGILSFDNLRSGIFFLRGRRKNCRHFFLLETMTGSLITQ